MKRNRSSVAAYAVVFAVAFVVAQLAAPRLEVTCK